MEKDIPLLVEFVRGSTLSREKAVERTLPILRNGPPGTYVHFADGRRVPVPTDQVVLRDDTSGAARVGFGGMKFVGVEDRLLVFRRFQDLLPEEFLSPERGFRMTLEPETVANVFVHGESAWKNQRPPNEPGAGR